MKYSTAHFPRGTIVQYCVGNPEFNETKTKTVDHLVQNVDHLVQNGVRSWVIVSTDKAEGFPAGGTFNIEHVTKIIKRGDGPVVFVNRLTPDFETVHVTGIKKSKHWYQPANGISWIVGFLANDLAPKNAVIDFEKLFDYLHSPINPVGIKRIPYSPDSSRTIHSVSKKRLKKFLKQNINRFLMKLDVAQKVEDEMYDDYDESDFEIKTTPLEDLFPKKVYTPEDLTTSHQAKRCMEAGTSYKGILTTEEAKRYLADRQCIVTIHDHHEDNDYFMFTDDHCFGVGVLPKDFVPVTTYLPMNVTPREGLEDGIVDTIEKYMAVFCSGKKQISSVEELCEYLNTRDTQAQDETNDYDGSYFDDQRHPLFDEDEVNNIDGFIW